MINGNRKDKKTMSRAVNEFIKNQLDSRITLALELSKVEALKVNEIELLSVDAGRVAVKGLTELHDIVAPEEAVTTSIEKSYSPRTYRVERTWEHEGIIICETEYADQNEKIIKDWLRENEENEEKESNENDRKND